MIVEASSQIYGVVEGFYGLPWNARQRHRLFGWLKASGLNTYLYAPKDDVKHRLRWRELYDDAQVAEIGALVRDCQRHGLRFIFALAPGLDIHYAQPSELEAVIAKLTQILDLGCRDFALLFDDIPAAMNPDDAGLINSLSEAQSQVTNDVLRWLRGRAPAARLLFCPVEYAGALTLPSVEESPYLQGLGDGLAPDIEIFWTGDHIISGVITSDSVKRVAGILKHKLVLWDNLYANDYDSRRLFMGPFAGREPSIRDNLNGILINPNCQFEVNYLPVRSFAAFALRGEVHSRKLMSSLLRDWLVLVEPDDQIEVRLEDLELLLDMCYLPFENGPRAVQFLANLRKFVDSQELQAPEGLRVELQGFSCDVTELLNRMARIRNRDLFHALYRYLWDLKEELQYVDAYLIWRCTQNGERFAPKNFRPGLFRGGLIADLQRAMPFPGLKQ